jgi:hypothetical protein
VAVRVDTNVAQRSQSSGMEARSVLGCLLLSLALILVAEGVLDGAALRGARRPQWRAGDHSAAVRLAPKSPLVGALETPAVAARARADAMLPQERPGRTAPRPAPIFVPPRA